MSDGDGEGGDRDGGAGAAAVRVEYRSADGSGANAVVVAERSRAVCVCVLGGGYRGCGVCQHDFRRALADFRKALDYQVAPRPAAPTRARGPGFPLPWHRPVLPGGLQAGPFRRRARCGRVRIRAVARPWMRAEGSPKLRAVCQPLRTQGGGHA